MAFHPPRCPYCNSVLPQARLGVALPPFKARILDLVMRGGQDGIQTVDLLAIAYDGAPMWNGPRGTRSPVAALRQNIRQINERIDAVGYRIVNSGGAYRLEHKL